MILPEESTFIPTRTLYGLGDASVQCNCDPLDPACLTQCAAQGGSCQCDGSDPDSCANFCAMGGGTTGWTSSSGDPWYVTALKTAGAAAGVTLPFLCRYASWGCPALVPGTSYPLVPPPWYSTPGGVAVILLGVGVVGVGGYYALKKK
jgi:hypothetical protein